MRVFTVVLGSITVADYLDRTDIVRRATDNRLAFDDSQRWAEPLRAGVQRVLGDELTRRLGPGVWIAPGGGRGGAVDLEVPMDIDAFERNATGQVVLSVRWEVRPTREGRKPVRQHTQYVEALPANPVVGVDAADQVAAMSAALGAFAADVAVALIAAQKE